MVDGALQKDDPYCREVVICKNGRLEGGGGRDPVRGGKNLSWINFASQTQMPFIIDSVTSIIFLANLLVNIRLNRYSYPSANCTISLNYAGSVCKVKYQIIRVIPSKWHFQSRNQDIFYYGNIRFSIRAMPANRMQSYFLNPIFENFS